MGFIIKQSDSYVWPVSVELASNNISGTFEKHTFDVEFKRVPQSRVEKIIADSQQDAVRDRQIVEELVVGWKGVTDGENDLPFSQKNLGTLMDIPGVERAVIVAWLDSLSGAKRKN